MRKLMLVATLAAVAVLAFAPLAAAQSGDKDCSDFPSQAAAQAYFTSHGGSASNNFNDLDANHNGVACEDYDYGTSGQSSTMMGGSTMTESSGMMQASTVMQSSGMQTSTATPAQGASAATMTSLPKSGGPALLLPAAAFLLGAGLLTAGVLRKR